MVAVENLNRWYTIDKKRHQILKDISFHVERGEFVLLRGVSGSGKTTLLSILAGLEKPSSGKVLIDGEPIAKLPDMHLSHFRAKRVGMIFQHFNLIDSLSLEDNVLVPLVALKIELQEAKAMVKRALEDANISHKSEAYPNKLSGGEKQRGAIARAIVADPVLLLCDEPTANLDRANSLLFIEALKKLHKEGKTIIVATHDPIFEKVDFHHRVIDIKDGQIV